ncbi:hypothetical protein ACI63T_001166 [Neisseria gonorrhoeae]
MPRPPRCRLNAAEASDGIFTQAEQCPALSADRATERQIREN